MRLMASRRFLNPAQPQTLVIAVYLLYMNSAFLLFDLLRLGVFPLLFIGLIIAGIVAGYGVANEFKWAYGLALAVAFLPFALRMYYTGSPFDTPILTLMFEIALIALLLHPQSRDYQRIWFK